MQFLYPTVVSRDWLIDSVGPPKVCDPVLRCCHILAKSTDNIKNCKSTQTVFEIVLAAEGVSRSISCLDNTFTDSQG